MYYLNNGPKPIKFQLGSKQYDVPPGHAFPVDDRFDEVIDKRGMTVKPIATLKEAASYPEAPPARTVVPRRFRPRERDTTVERVSARRNPELLEEAGVFVDELDADDDEEQDERRAARDDDDDDERNDASDEPRNPTPRRTPGVASRAVADAVTELGATGVGISAATRRAVASERQKRVAVSQRPAVTRPASEGSKPEVDMPGDGPVLAKTTLASE